MPPSGSVALKVITCWLFSDTLAVFGEVTWGGSSRSAKVTVKLFSIEALCSSLTRTRME